MTNPSSSNHDRGAPPFNFPEIDEDFERRTKHRQDRPLPQPQKPKEKGKVASFEERTKARHDRSLPHPIRPTRNREDGTFTTRVHYNGVIEAEEGCGRQYLNGELEYIHKCDPDRWSKLEVDDVLEKLGIDVTGLDYFYLKPRMSLEDGLVRLFDNKSALEMAELGIHYRVIDVYAIQVGAVVIDATQEVVSQITQEHIESSGRDNISRELQFEGRKDGLTASKDDSEEIDDGSGEKNQRDEDDWFDGEDLEGEDKMSVEGEDILELEDESLGSEDEEFEDEAAVAVKGKSKAIGNAKGKGKVKGNRKGKAEGTAGKKRKGKGNGKAAGNDKDKGKAVDEDDNVADPTFVDSDYDLSDKEEDEIMAAQVEGWKNVVNAMRTIGDGSGDDEDSDNLPSDSPSSGTEPEHDLGDRDNEVPAILSRRYKASTDLNDPKWEVGLRFNTKQEFTELVRHQGVKLGKKLRLKKNDNIRCIAHCKGVLRSKKTKADCPWLVNLTYRSGLGCWQISQLRNFHKCGGASFNHGCANAKYLSQLYKEDMRVFPGMTVGQFIEKVHCEMKITISSGKAKRAMARARYLIEGDLIKQYKRLHDYKAEILRANPGSTVVLSTQRLSDGTDKFKAIYIAYEACKTSFKEHCRRIVGLDGCHLKGQAKGILLTAIGLDPNDQIFPIAFAVVRIENTDTWNWFLRLLVQDLEIKDSSKWTFISDRQKGLINAVRTNCKDADHRFCVWHMHQNFKKTFPSPTLKDKIWEAARATNTYAFDKVMEEVKDLNSAAFKWLTMHTAKESWSRAFFGYEAKCDILVNNISECYNRVLLFAREKPLYGMLECIRMYLMDRFTSRRKMGARLDDCFGPKIRKKIEKLKGKIGECMVREAGEWIYQVNTMFNEQFVVDLRDRTCSCRRWMLTGIPCHHAIAAIEMTNENVDSFVDKCYSKETFQKVYEPIIYPVQGPQLWPKTSSPDVVPPELTRLPGRPKGARQKTVEEQAQIRKDKVKAALRFVEVQDKDDGSKRMSRKGLMSEYMCGLCGEKGHNKRRCPQGIQLGQPKGPTTRKKRNRDEEQPTCTLCHQPGHNRATCTSSIADMYKDSTTSEVDATTSVSLKKKN